jgi:hypothetical protein
MTVKIIEVMQTHETGQLSDEQIATKGALMVSIILTFSPYPTRHRDHMVVLNDWCHQIFGLIFKRPRKWRGKF